MVDFPPTTTPVPGLTAYDLSILDSDDHHFEPHRHRFFEIIHLATGSAEHVIDDFAQRLSGPVAILVSPWQLHSWRTAIGTSGRVVIFTEDFVATSLAPAMPLPDIPLLGKAGPCTSVPLEGQSQQDFLRSLAHLERELETGEPHAASICGALIFILLAIMQRAATPGLPPPPQSEAMRLVHDLRGLVIEAPSISLSVEACAARLGVSRHQLDKAARVVTGMSAHSVMHDQIILAAKRLLSGGRMTVTETAQQLGFNDNSYFSRMFKKRTGVSPGQFRLRS